MNNAVRFAHFHHTDLVRGSGFTVAYQVNPDRSVSYGIGRCNAKDQFIKREGRAVAQVRLNSRPSIVAADELRSTLRGDVVDTIVRKNAHLFTKKAARLDKALVEYMETGDDTTLREKFPTVWIEMFTPSANFVL